MPKASTEQVDKKDPAGEPAPIWIGCSGWAYPSWRPAFYPANTSPKKLLEAYASRLNSVEVNYTFRSLPTAAIVEGWLGATPEAFRFSFKAPQRITHFARLHDSSAPLEAFAQSVQSVSAAGRLGVILFQLPPNFVSDPGLLGAFLVTAKGAFARFGAAAVRMAFEFRHASWFVDRTYSTLEQHGAALCVAGSDDLQTPDVATAPFACYRLRQSEYSEAELEAVRATLLGRAQQGEVFAYFKHEEDPGGALRAAAVLDGLRR
jgi:uncharacterized protein YecE (DUF72 family)